MAIELQIEPSQVQVVQTLAHYEAIIERGLETFVEVGNALLAIRDGRLYKANHATFEDYCRQKWDMSTRHANRLVASVAVMQNLGPIGSQIPSPQSERQARPLTRLEPEQQREAWARAVETAPLVNGEPKVTGRHVQDTVDELIGQRSRHVRQVMGSSESSEWYTPRHIVELTLRLFDGMIDTDPCSNSKAAPNVPATFLYTREDDGLKQPWHGAVYMNPPYGKEIPRWVETLVEKYEQGEIEQAITLLPGRIDTRWFQPLYAYPMCMIKGRLNFSNSSVAAPFPSIIVYLGDNRKGFIEVFSELGPIMERIG